VLGAVDALVAADGAQTITEFRSAQNPPALIEAAIACRAYERLEARGHLDAMLARYGTLRQYLPAFFALPFQAAAGTEALLTAIEILRALDAGTRTGLTIDDPHGFVQADWRSHLVTGGKLNRGIWEISLAFAVRDALRAGSLFLIESRDHVSFWNLVYDDKNWQQTREQAYQRLDLPINGQAFLTKITREFERAVRAAEHGLASNRFAAVSNGRVLTHCVSCAPRSVPACPAYASKTCCRMSTNGADSPAPSSRSVVTSPAVAIHTARCLPH
jgi:hypothetical protein